VKLITSLFALALVSSFAFAADEKPAGDKPKKTPDERFKALDTNGDGSVSLDEFKAGPAGKRDAARAEQTFGKRDADKDGKLTLEEFSAAPKKDK
jgi:Ca2+-binding EF-hand superfamily protein